TGLPPACSRQAADSGQAELIGGTLLFLLFFPNACFICPSSALSFCTGPIRSSGPGDLRLDRPDRTRRAAVRSPLGNFPILPGVGDLSGKTFPPGPLTGSRMAWAARPGLF